ncbi:MAG: hypothetical protein MK066_10185 [Crocinitomicaceae bacterium]|nr:hypothetical protein [Crocinitomicaceae bacterium]
MIQLAMYTYVDVVKWVLIISLIILLLIIGYKKLLKYLGKGVPPKEDYCVLYPLEKDPVEGEIEFYFTSDKKKSFEITILNSKLEQVLQVVSKESCFIGGNIIRYDSSKLSNGQYFYCLKTPNQKTMKKMIVNNG